MYLLPLLNINIYILLLMAQNILKTMISNNQAWTKIYICLKNPMSLHQLQAPTNSLGSIYCQFSVLAAFWSQLEIF